MLLTDSVWKYTRSRKRRLKMQQTQQTTSNELQKLALDTPKDNLYIFYILDAQSNEIK